MRFLLSLALLLALHAMCGLKHAYAQDGFQWMSVQPDNDRCLTRQALERRTEHYLRDYSATSHVSIIVQLSTTEVSFSVMRDGERLAKRAFSQLPDDCASKRDALGLAIALALEAAGVAHVAFDNDSTNDSSPANVEAGWNNEVDTASGADATNPERADEQKHQHSSQLKSDEAPHESSSSQQRAAEENPAADAIKSSQETKPTSEETSEVDQDTDAPHPTRAGPTIALGLSANAGVLLGVKPGLALVLAAGPMMRIGRLTVELDGLWSPESEHSIANVPAGQTLVSLYAGRLATCVGGSTAGPSLGGCLAFEGGALVAQGMGYDGVEHTRLPWLAGAISAEVKLPLIASLGVRLCADAMLNLMQPVLVVAGTGGGRSPESLIGLIAVLGVYWAPP